MLHHRALDRKKALARAKRAGQTVPLADDDNVGSDPQIDLLVAEREELRHLAELAEDVLRPSELEVLALSRLGVSRAEIGQRQGLSVRQVERWLERAQRKLDEGREAMEEHGRCAMLALTIALIKARRIGPEHPRYADGIAHLDWCWRCRANHAIDPGKAA